jgi:plastocyanin
MLTVPARAACMLLVAAFVASLSVGCDDGDPPAARVAPVEGSGAIAVIAQSRSFDLERITVERNTTTSIALENRDDVAHTLTVYLDESGNSEIAADTGEVPAGERGEAVVFFSTPGTHAYRCTIHPDAMHGVLTVR